MNQISREAQEQILKLRAKIEELQEELKTMQRLVNVQKLNNQSNNKHQEILRNKTNNQEERIKRLETSLKHQKTNNQTLQHKLTTQIESFQRAEREHQKRIQDLLYIVQDNFNPDKEKEKLQAPNLFQALKNQLKKIMNQMQDYQQQNRKLSQRLKEVSESCKQFQDSTIKHNSCLPSENNSSFAFNLPSSIQECSSILPKQPKPSEQGRKLEVKQTIQQEKLNNSVTQVIHICNLEDKIKELEEDLNRVKRENRTLQQKMDKMSVQSQLRENQSRVYEPSEPNEQNIIQRRRMMFEGEPVDNNMLNLSKSNHKSIFQAIARHYEQTVQKKKMTFLNMLAFWSEQKLKKIHQNMEDLN